MVSGFVMSFWFSTLIGLYFPDPTKGEREHLKTEDEKELYDYLLELTPRLLYEMAVYGTACK